MMLTPHHWFRTDTGRLRRTRTTITATVLAACLWTPALATVTAATAIWTGDPLALPLWLVAVVGGVLGAGTGISVTKLVDTESEGEG